MNIFSKNKFYNILILSALSISVFYACKDEDNYDWSKLEPGTQTITGPDTIRGNNITQYEYLAIPRGGSKFIWTVLSGPAEVTNDASNVYKAVVKSNTTIDTVAYVMLEEVTHGGKIGISDTFKIIIGGFCTYNFSQLMGDNNFTYEYMDFAPYPVTFTQLAGDTIMVDNFFGMGWPVKFAFSKDENEKISVVSKEQYEYNGELVEVTGTGTYNTCKSTINLKFAVLKLNGDTLENGAGNCKFYK